MKVTQSAHHAPFPIEKFGNRLGGGKDNLVRALPIPGKENDYVVKINHDKGTRTTEQVEAGIRYKREKYEILKLFLGDFIPETGFVLGTKVDGPRSRPVEYVVQQRLPNRYLSSLTAEQRSDPRLVTNMLLLMVKMENMYKSIGNVNARTGGQSASLDAKLDLGGISGYVREHIDETFNNDTAMVAIAKKGDTPNILVDPESMDIYCIDFDEGEWTKDKATAKSMLFDIVEARQDVQSVIRLQPSDLSGGSWPKSNGVAA